VSKVSLETTTFLPCSVPFVSCSASLFLFSILMNVLCFELIVVQACVQKILESLKNFARSVIEVVDVVGEAQ